MIKISRKLLVALIVLLVVLVIFVGYLFWRMRPSVAANDSKTQVARVVEEISEYMVLPEDELPTMATVSDPKKLAGQEFFSRAKAGDIVLIYSRSRRAILWRPSEKKIIEVSMLGQITQ